MDMLGYYVAHKRGKMLWLAADMYAGKARTWTENFTDAAEFTTAKEAQAAADIEAAKGDIVYVFGLLHS